MLAYAVKRIGLGLLILVLVMVAMYALLLFAVTLRWLPAIGAGEAGDFVSQAKALIMPAAAIALGWIGYIARMVRASMMEVMGEPHIRTARSFGLPEWKIVSKYA